MSCNTTSGQNVLLEWNSGSSYADATDGDAFPLWNLMSDGPSLNPTSLNQYWLEMANIIVGVFATPGLTSLLLPSVVGNNLTSLRIEFFGIAPCSAADD